MLQTCKTLGGKGPDEKLCSVFLLAFPEMYLLTPTLLINNSAIKDRTINRDIGDSYIYVPHCLFCL